ncbi:MAG TPA: amidoligase family protein [Candidatus Xenobia bacterium]|jgi:hypothetical protein
MVPNSIQSRPVVANGARLGERRDSGRPADAFHPVVVPDQMSIHDIRQVAEASRVAARPELKPVDINKIPFGIEIELEGFDANAATPAIQGLGTWNVVNNLNAWKLVKDASLSSGTGGEAVSPPMTLENGQAEAQIRQAVATMVGLGGQATRNCGLHFHVDARALGERGLANLAMMEFEQEHALFRISQNGYPEHRGLLKGNGWRHEMPYYYCRPLSSSVADPTPLLHADTPNQFRNAIFTAIPEVKMALQQHPRPALPPVDSNGPFQPDHKDVVRYHGINFNAYWYCGTVEFRLFEGTTDPDQIMENLKMALGMVAAAASDSYTYLQPHALQVKNVPVSKEAFNYFLDRVAATPAHRQRIEENFAKSGGVLQDDAPVTDKHVLNTSVLQQEGFKFFLGDKQLHSPFEILGQAAKHPMTVSIDKASADLAQIGSVEGITRRLQAGQALAQAGIRIVNDRHEDVPLAQVALLKGGNLCAEKDGDRIPINSDFPLEVLTQAIDPAQWQPDVKTLVGSVPALRQAGYQVTRDGHPLSWQTAIAVAFSQGKLAVERDGRTMPINSLQALEQNVTVPDTLAPMNPAQKTAYAHAQQLVAKGFNFSTQGRALDAKGLAFLNAITAPAADLQVQAPGQSGTSPLPSAALRDEFLNIELGQDAQLSEATRRQLELVDGLRAKGYVFYHPGKQSEIKSRSGGVLALQTGAPIGIKQAVGRVQLTADEPGLKNLLAMADGHPEQMDLGFRAAAERADQLTAGVRLEIASGVQANTPEVLAALAVKTPVVLIDQAGQRTEVKGIEHFMQASSPWIDKTTMTPEQSEALAGLQTLLDAHKIVATPVRASNTANLQKVGLLPWMFASNVGLKVAAAGKSGGTSAVDIANWQDLQKFVNFESGTHLNDDMVQLRQNLQSIRSHGVTLCRPGARKNEETWHDLDSAAANELTGTGVQAGLPSLMMWKGFPSLPTKSVTLHSAAEVQRLADKLAG